MPLSILRPLHIRNKLFYLLILVVFSASIHKAHAYSMEEAYFYFLLSQIVAEKPEEVEYYLKRAIERDKKSLFLKKTLFAFYLQQSNITSAEKLGKELIQRVPEDREVILLLVRLYLLQKRPSKAITALEKYLTKNPKDEQFLSILISIYLQEKEWDQALTKLEQLEKLHPDNYIIPLYKARVFREKGDIASAKKSYLRSLELEPSNRALVIELIKFLEGIRDYKEMERILLNYLSQNPEDRDFLRLLLGIYFEQKDYDKSEKLIREYVEKEGNQPELIFYLGLTLEQKNRQNEAISLYESIPVDSPWYFEAQRRLFEIFRKKDLKKAKDLLNTIRGKKFKEKSFFLFLAHSYEKIDQCEEGVNVAKEGLTLFPMDVDLTLALATNYACLEDYEGVLEIVEPLLKAYPQDAYILNFVGYSLVELNKDLERAEDLLIKANQLKPEDPYIEDSLGWLYYKKSQLEKAKFYLEKALANLKGEEEPVILDHLGDVNLKLGNLSSACDLYKRALEKSIHHRERKKIEEKVKICP